MKKKTKTKYEEGIEGMSTYSRGMGTPYVVGGDADGFSLRPQHSIRKTSDMFHWLRDMCWDKFNENPQVHTSILDYVGRLAGRGFAVHAEDAKIDEIIEWISNDPRNRLHTMMPKYVARSGIEGELHLIFTLHTDGFVEIDFREAYQLGGPWSDTGIIPVPNKPTMPLVYMFTDDDGQREQIPSIYAARYPEVLANYLNKEPEGAKPSKRFLIDRELLDKNKDAHPRFTPFNGYRRFVVSWDTGFLTTRNVSHLRTVLRWLKYYEDLKMYEIDHKKSAGAYLWVHSFADANSFNRWSALSQTQKEATGLLKPVSPGGKIFLPPGMTIEVKNPQLPKLSGEDTDVLGMVTSGLNTSEDQVMGTQNSTYAAAKSSRGPAADRTQDNISKFETFLRYDFWDSIFFLLWKMGKMEEKYMVNTCITFEKEKPKFKKIGKLPRDLIEFAFPASELADVAALTSAFLGVKHGSLPDMLGIPRAEVVKRLGLGSYPHLRKRHAEEEENYPTLAPAVDQEAAQEVQNGEKPKAGVPATPKKVAKK